MSSGQGHLPNPLAALRGSSNLFNAANRPAFVPPSRRPAPPVSDTSNDAPLDKTDSSIPELRITATDPVSWRFRCDRISCIDAFPRYLMISLQSRPMRRVPLESACLSRSRISYKGNYLCRNTPRRRNTISSSVHLRFISLGTIPRCFRYSTS